MKLNFDINFDEYKIINTILNKYLHNTKVYVFGSRAKNSSRFNSDLDLALQSKGKIDKGILIDLKEEFDDSDLSFSVDIIDLNTIDENFKEIIENEKIEFPLQKNIPKLRFKEFSGKWEKKQLKEVTSYVDYRGRAPIKTEKGHFLVTAKNIKKGFIDYECSKEYVAENNYLNVMSKGLPEVGDILLTTEAPMGNVAQVDKKDIALAQRVIKFRGKEMLLNSYLLHYMLSTTYQNLISRKSIGTTVQGISGKELHKTKISFPSLEEQEKIASFLSSVDTKIEQLTSKEKLLKEYKKGVMQKIFNYENRKAKDNSLSLVDSEPEAMCQSTAGGIRFKADDGSEFCEWEEKKLKSFISNFIVPMRDKPKDLLGEIPWCRIEDFDGKYLLNSKSKQGVSLSTVKEMNLKIFPIDTLLVSCSADLGRCAIVKKELISNQTFIGLVPNKDLVNVEFLYYVMKLSSNRLTSLSSGTTIAYLSRKEFENFKIKLPSLEEQNKIANFLSSIDKKIEQVQKQLEQTKEFKKALLQQMFV